MKNIRTLALLALLAVASTAGAQKYVGGDISLLPSYEQNGSKYMDQNGSTISVLPFCREQGMNAMRVRLFVDPTKATTAEQRQGVVQDLSYVKQLACRIKDAGFSLLLDFHYSDTWADPSKQWTPDAWKSLSDTGLAQQIYDYTHQVLDTLVAAGCAPDFIQTGNEISYGFLWGERDTTSPKKCYMGNSANWERFGTLLKRAAEACRAVCPQAKIIIHTERVANSAVLYNFYQQMHTLGVSYDIIGLSYYPYYHGSLSQLEDRISWFASADDSYGTADKPVWIVETGYYHKWQPSSVSYDYSSTFPISDEGQRLFADSLISALNRHSNATGLFWWMMEANEYGHTGSQQTTSDWYNAGLWDNETGRALPALYELRKFLTSTPTNINNVASKWPEADGKWYRPDGTQASGRPQKGLYIHNGKKVVMGK